LLLTNVGCIKDDPPIRKTPCSMQGFELAMAGMSDAKKPA
jgi:hypothetical protein